VQTTLLRQRLAETNPIPDFARLRVLALSRLDMYRSNIQYWAPVETQLK
jgi:hypothetical protein